jgi:hypothetical protein
VARVFDSPLAINRASKQFRSLVGAYPTLENTGNVLKARLLGQDGVFQNGPTWHKDPTVGQYIHVDGTNQQVDIPYSALWYPQSSPEGLAVSAWIRSTDDVHATQRIGYIWAWDFSNSLGWAFGVRAGESATYSDCLFWHCGGGYSSSNTLDTTTVIADGIWHHLLLTHLGGVNQAFVDSIYIGQTTGADTPTAEDQPLWIGYDPNAATHQELDIADLRIYKYRYGAEMAQAMFNPLTRHELYEKAHLHWPGYTAPKIDTRVRPSAPHIARWRLPRPPDGPIEMKRQGLNHRGLKAWWPTLRHSGGVLRDISGYGHHGTLVNGVSIGLEGEVGRTLEGETVDTTYIDIANASSLVSNTMSFLMWFRMDTLSAAHDKLIWVGPDLTSGEASWQFRITDDAGAKLRFQSFNTTWQQSDYALSTYNQMALYGFRFYTGTVRFYINGEFKQQFSHGHSSLISANYARFMSRPKTSEPDHTDGAMGSAFWYDRALYDHEFWNFYVNRWGAYEPAPRRAWSGYTAPEPQIVNATPSGAKRAVSRPPVGQVTVNRSSPLTRGLIGGWVPFASPGGGIVRNINTALIPNHGTINGPTWTMDPGRGWVLNYPNSGSNRIEAGGASVVNALTELSVVAWIRPDAVVDYGSIWTTMTTGEYGFSLYTYDEIGVAEDTFGISFWNADDNNYAEPHAPENCLSAAEWALVGFSFLKGTQASLELYLDGLPVGVTWRGADGDCAIGDGNAIYMGNDYWSELFDGLIGPVLLWNRRLSPAEHFSLYNPLTRWDYLAPTRRTWAALYEAAAGTGLVARLLNYFRRRRIT